MIPHSLSSLVPWIMLHGYFLFFMAAVIEGSLVTTAAGVVAGLGYFNIFLVITLSILGDLVGDVTYYLIGRFSKNILKSKFFKFFGFKEQQLENTTKLLHKHTGKALLFIKLSPLIGVPGLISVGAVQVAFKKFFKTTFIISLLKAIFFAILGYISAQSYLKISKVINHGQYVILGLLAFLIIIHLLYRRVARRLSKQLEE